MLRRFTLWLLTAVIAASTPLALVNAASDSGNCDYVYYRLNRILWDDECSNVISCSTDSGSAQVTNVVGDDNIGKIFNYLVAKGFTPAQAAGVVGNIEAESGFSPTRQENAATFPAGGWGLAQWTGARRTNPSPTLGIVAYLKSLTGNLTEYYNNKYGGATSAASGYAPDGVPQEKNDALILGEMDFLFKEVSRRSASPEAVLAKRATAGQTEIEALKSQDSAEHAAQLWVYSFEHPTNLTGQAGLNAMAATAAQRASNATAVLAKYQKNASGSDTSDVCDDSSTSGDSGDTATGSTRDKIVAIAKQELAKWDSGQLKPGSGYVKYLQGNGRTDWCAYFASWVYKTAGVPLTGGTGAVANVSTIKAIGEKGGKFTWHPAGSYTPKPGDLATYGFHVNIVISVPDAKHYRTIGGNEHSPTENFNTSRVFANPWNYWPPIAQGFVSPND